MGSQLAKHVTLKELSTLYGWNTSRSALRRLKKRLQDRERVSGAQFLQKLGTGPNSPLVTTVPLIRLHCPEMVDRPAEVNDALNMVAEVITKLRAEVGELRAANKDLRAKVKVLETEIQKVKAA